MVWSGLVDEEKLENFNYIIWACEENARREKDKKGKCQERE